MKFGPVPTQNALGAILAHSAQAGPVKIRKGTILTSPDIAALQAAGQDVVTVAILGGDDLHEDAAASQLGAALVPDPAAAGLRLSQAATGRVNIYATKPGIVGMRGAGLAALNAVNPMITIATLAPHQRVAAGTMIATVKIISYGVAKTDVVTACAAGQAAVWVQAPVFQTATLIETQIGVTPPATKGREALNTRLTRLSTVLTDRVITPHAVPDIATAISAAPGDVIFLLTGSATSDIADTAPEAVRAAGGAVIHFGMPVDPGNLLFLGVYGEKPVIGLPGCARSIALNGADWVLERVLCGVAVTPQDIAAMGVGGLLKETPGRTHPRRRNDPQN